MPNIFSRIFQRQPNSASEAKERLRLVLIHDRTDLTPGMLAELKDDLIEVISRRVSIDPSAVRIEMAQEGREQRLIADIPLRPARKRRMS